MSAGWISGLLWGISTAVLGCYFSSDTGASLAFLGTILAIATAFLNDFFSALWMWIGSALKRRTRSTLKAFTTRNGLTIAAGALLGGPVGMCGYVVALANLGPALTAILAALAPAVSTLGSTLIHHEHRKPHQWLGLLICVGAAIFASLSPIHIEGNLIVGLIGGVVCVLGWAGEVIVSVIALRLVDEPIEDGFAITIRQTVSTLTYLAVILPIMGVYPHLADVAYSWHVSYIALAGLCGTLSFVLYYRAIAQVGAGKAVCLNITYVFWIIVMTSVFSLSLPNWHYLCAAALIFIGALLMYLEPTTSAQSDEAA